MTVLQTEALTAAELVTIAHKQIDAFNNGDWEQMRGLLTADTRYHEYGTERSTDGLITAWILFQNGFMLGVCFKLCANYGLSGALLAFIASHGVLEISAIILAGGGGFVVANALLNPGSYSRGDAMSVRTSTAFSRVNRVAAQFRTSSSVIASRPHSG